MPRLLKTARYKLETPSPRPALTLPLDRGLLKMHRFVYPIFQPVLDLRTGHISHYEALARIVNDTTFRRHAKLIMSGEELGFVYLLDISILQQVVAALRANVDICVATNVSIVTIQRHAQDFLEALRQGKDVADRLILEMTETVRPDQLDVMDAFVAQARTLGCRIAIDDYGAGHFNPDLVYRFQPEMIKVDGSVIDAVVAQRDAQMLEHVLGMASDCGSEVVTEKIDSAEKFQLVKAAGISHAQGFYISYAVGLVA